jgi:mRNA interferase YafQ
VREIVFSKQFERDVKRAKKRGKMMEKLKAAIEVLASDNSLPPQYQDHKLAGEYIGRRECHLEPDWLLVYLRTDEAIVFERTGTHSDLFE